MLIPLTQGKFAIVDPEDYEWLMQWKWSFNTGYAVRGTRKGGKQLKFRMHRVIAKTPNGFETDHINRNKLDNRRCNLRVCPPRINRMNRPAQSNNVLGLKGVYFKKRNKKFVAQIGGRNNQKHLGYFNTAEEAHKAFLMEEQRRLESICLV